MKLVREYINEKFTEDSDPIHDMNIGAIRLIKKWLDDHYIKHYTINNDGTIDVNYTVQLSNRLLEKLPDYIQFGKITNGYFSIRHNSLTTLKGCPYEILKEKSSFNGDFYCDHNNLTSLEYAPKKITGSFNCYNNDKYFKIEDVKKVCDVGRGILV
jgi:hypothetical protein